MKTLMIFFTLVILTSSCQYDPNALQSCKGEPCPSISCSEAGSTCNLVDQANSSVNLVAIFKSRGQLTTASDNYISGLAPFPLFTDLTQSTATNFDPFGDVGYRIDYGDRNSGTWEHTGKSKNIEEGGPLGYHLYETPGIYTVTVSARSPDGDLSETITLNVRVYARDDVQHGGYSSANTTTIRTTDTTWPAGFPLSNHRYLLEAGLDATSWPNINAGSVVNSVFEKVGSGSDPVVGRWNMESNIFPGSGYVFSHSLTFIDLNANTIMASMSHHDFTYVRGRMRSIWENGANIGYFYRNAANQEIRESLEFPSRVALHEVTFDFDNNPQSYNMTFDGVDFVVAGCHLSGASSGATGFNMRVWSFHRMLITHNLVEGSVTHGNFKFHSGQRPIPSAYESAPGEYPENPNIFDSGGPGKRSRFGISRSNVLGSAGVTYNLAMSFAPQSVAKFMRVSLDPNTNTFTRIGGKHSVSEFPNGQWDNFDLIAAGANSNLPPEFTVDNQSLFYNYKIADNIGHIVNALGNDFQISLTQGGFARSFSTAGDAQEFWLVTYWDIGHEALQDMMSEFEIYRGNHSSHLYMSGKNIIHRSHDSLPNGVPLRLSVLGNIDALDSNFIGPFKADDLNDIFSNILDPIQNVERMFP
jgi:hypothetical protein